MLHLSHRKLCGLNSQVIYVGESFVRLIPFKDHINIEANVVLEYKVMSKEMLQIFLKQNIPADVLKQISAETLS